MKKVILTLIAVVLTAGFASAQDLATATETYNSGAAALSNGEKASALEFFQQALTQAEACGEEGADVIANCKGIIPTLHLSIAKDLIKASDFDAALAKLAEAGKVAEEYEAADVLADAAELVPQVKMSKATKLYSEKSFADAAAIYKEVLDADATNGMAALRLGMALNGAGDTAGSIAAYEQALANGQEANAKKQLATIYLKDASAQLKAKKYAEAITAALKSNEYNESGNAYKIAGTAANSLANKEDAAKYLSKYLELSPNAADAAQIKAAVEALKK